METKRIDLDSFIVKEEELDENLLAQILDPYLGKIFPDGSVEYKDRFEKLNAARKVLIEMLVKKAKVIKQIGGLKSEKISVEELTNKSNLGINKESIKKSFNRELKIIVRSDRDGEYYVPNYNLQKAKEYLEKKI